MKDFPSRFAADIQQNIKLNTYGECNKCHQNACVFGSIITEEENKKLEYIRCLACGDFIIINKNKP